MTPTPGAPAESTEVQLTRMEGKLDRIADRVVDLRGDVERLKGDVSELKSETQTLREGAEADKKTAVALALALKEADETRRNKTEQTWSPFAKTVTIILAIVGIATLYLQMRPSG